MYDVLARDGAELPSSMEMALLPNQRPVSDMLCFVLVGWAATPF